MKAHITWDAGWGETSIDVEVAGVGDAVMEALAMVEDAIDTNMEGPAYFEFMDALHEGGEVEVIVKVKSERSAGNVGAVQGVART